MGLSAVPVLLMTLLALGLSTALVLLGRWVGPKRSGAVKQMPYESGMDPIHDTHRRFDVRFYMVAIAFLVFDVELLFLYPWAVSRTNEHGLERAIEARIVATAPASAPQTGGMDDLIGRETTVVFFGVAVFFVLLALGLIYDWRKGVFQWR
jgi:NADH-quinone oxidoreductase subunit A